MFRIYAEESSPDVIAYLSEAGLMDSFEDAVVDIPRDKAVRKVLSVLGLKAGGSLDATAVTTLANKVLSRAGAGTAADVSEAQALEAVAGSSSATSASVEQVRAFLADRLGTMPTNRLYFTLRDEFGVCWSRPDVREQLRNVYRSTQERGLQLTAVQVVAICGEMMLDDDAYSTREFYLRNTGSIDVPLNETQFVDFMCLRFEGTPAANVAKRVKVWGLMSALDDQRRATEAVVTGRDTSRPT